MKFHFFQDALNMIADAGREIIDKRRGHDALGVPYDMRHLCEDLLSQKGEALGVALAREVVTTYAGLNGEARRGFFLMLRDEFGPDQAALDGAIQAYQNGGGQNALMHLSQAVESRRRALIRRINMAPGGTAAILSMREDLLRYLKTDPLLKPVDSDFAYLLSAWFNRGFLSLECVDWQTPAHILEKLIEYEAVHEIDGWDDLRRRLAQDRRCYAFFHPALPDEPLIFVEVALVKGMAGSIQDLLSTTPSAESVRQADTAIFYSISNCQKGLTGISFGNFLIKQVVEELRSDLPQLKTFATLSPIPGFGNWLKKRREQEDYEDYGLDPEIGEKLAPLDNPGWLIDEEMSNALKAPLESLCATYFLKEKRKDLPADPVARFHLGNGAQLARINFRGDTSEKGLKQSAGLLVNYLYDLKKIEAHHEAYAADATIAATKAVKQLVG